MLRDGTKTLEFWSVIILAALGVLKQTAFPNIPDQAFYTVILWILTRAGVKAATAWQAEHNGGVLIEANPAPAIKSSEGLLSAVAAPVLGVVEAVTGAPLSVATALPTMAYTLARTALKIFSRNK